MQLLPLVMVALELFMLQLAQSTPVTLEDREVRPYIDVFEE